MAVRATPIFIDGNTHPAEETRLAIGALLGTATGSFAGGVSAADNGHGVINSGDLAVTQNGTPNMSVNVAAGGCFIRGTQSANQGCYHLFNDASVNVAISAADATNPRRDLVIAQVRDAFYSGSSKDARITVVTGTPAASPSDPSLSSFPNALVLARVAVAANATSVGTANITDLRTRAGLQVPHTDTASGFGAGGTTNSTSYVNLPDASALSVVKYRADTKLTVWFSAGGAYSSATDFHNYAVRVNSVDYFIGQNGLAANTRTVVAGSCQVTGLAAGTYTVQPRVKVAGGAGGTITFDASSNWTMTVQESF